MGYIILAKKVVKLNSATIVYLCYKNTFPIYLVFEGTYLFFFKFLNDKK